MQSNDRSMCNRCATRSHGPRSGWSSVCGRSWKIINTWTQQLHWSLFYSSRSVPMCQKQSWVVSISLTHLCRTPLNRVLSHIQPLKIPLVTISLRAPSDAPYVWMDFHSAHSHSQHYWKPFLKIYDIFYQSKARGQRSIYSHKCIRNNCRRIHNQININL